MLLPRVLSLALFTLLAASQDDGQSQDNVLNNGRGETPCQMKTTFLESTCTNQPERSLGTDQRLGNILNFRADPNDDTTPTACTCTNVYFNLWSACAYTTTPANPPYPSCDTFQQNCSQAALNITTFPQSANTSQSYPDWAFFELPANGTFDIVAAIASTDSSKSHKWTIIQIVLPILVGVGVAVVSFLIYRWRKKNANRPRDWMKTTGGRPRFQFPSFSSRQMVRELNRSSSWSIDDREEDLGEYQFVSYPASLQGSQASGHVRLSPSSSRVPGPPPLKIPEKKPPVQTWPGKSIWKSPLQSVRQLSTSIPRPWRTRIGVKNVPGYPKFRVDAADSDSPLSQRPGAESLLGHPRRSRSNLQHETVFEQENEDDSDSDEEALPFIPQEHSRSNHDAEPPSNSALLISSNAGADSPNSSQRTLRQIPPRASPPRIPLPLLPPVPTLPPPPSASTSQQTVRPQEPPPRLAPPPPPQSVGRSQRPPTLPPAPTSPPPPRPTVTKQSPRSPRTPLPPPFLTQQSLPSPPLPSPALSNSASTPPQPRRRDSDGGSSVRTLPVAPAPPYVRAAPAPIQILPEPADDPPLHSAPPYAPAIPPKSPPAHSTVTRSERSGSEAARSVRRLPLPPG